MTSWNRPSRNKALAGLLALALCAAKAVRAASVDAPVLDIPVPDVTFTKVIGADNLSLPWLGQYVTGVYTFALSVVGLVASVMLIIGGFQYLTSAGDKARVAKGKKRIADALIGMVLAFGSYAMLYTINPALVSFEGLKLMAVQTNTYEAALAEDEEEVVGVVDGQDSPDAVPSNGACGESAVKYVDVGGSTGVNGSSAINVVTADSYKAVAAEVYKRTASLPGGPYSLVGTGRRPLGEAGDYYKCVGKPHKGDCAESGWSQTYKWEGKCLGKEKCSGAPICNPYGKANVVKDAQGLIGVKPGACPVADNCPHTTGSAVDITCTSPAFRKWYAQQYGKDKNGHDKRPAAEAPFYAPCQRILEEVMLNNGWCRLKKETWHFEKPLKSGKSACSYSASDVLGKDSVGNDYKDCNGVYELSTKTCIAVSF